MINRWGRAVMSGVVEPTSAWLVRRGIHPDAVTVLGTVGATASALWLIPTGHLFAGALAVWFFAMLDMLDGSMARARGVKSPFGGVLDSVCDRLADGAVFVGVTWWAASTGRWFVAGLALTCLLAGQLISYVKARAEGAGLEGGGGLVERPERLILGLTGIGLTGLGVPYAVEVLLSLLALGSVITVAQRVRAVWISAREQYGAATGRTGAAEAPAERPAPAHEPRDVER